MGQREEVEDILLTCTSPLTLTLDRPAPPHTKST